MLPGSTISKSICPMADVNAHFSCRGETATTRDDTPVLFQYKRHPWGLRAADRSRTSVPRKPDCKTRTDGKGQKSYGILSSGGQTLTARDLGAFSKSSVHTRLQC